MPAYVAKNYSPTQAQAYRVADTAINEIEGDCHVHKKEPVTCLQLILEGRRMKIARTLPEADTLVEELQNFRVKITPAAHEVFGASREGEHDDIVLAVVLACWWAERTGGIGVEGISVGGRVLESVPAGVIHS